MYIFCGWLFSLQHSWLNLITPLPLYLEWTNSCLIILLDVIWPWIFIEDLSESLRPTRYKKNDKCCLWFPFFLILQQVPLFLFYSSPPGIINLSSLCLHQWRKSNMRYLSIYLSGEFFWGIHICMGQHLPDTDWNRYFFVDVVVFSDGSYFGIFWWGLFKPLKRLGWVAKPFKKEDFKSRYYCMTQL